MPSSQPQTDANAIAGVLQEVFVADVTTAPRVCQSCGETHEIGTHRLYRGAGLVLRCPACEDLAAVIGVLPDRYVISLHGTWAVARQ